MKLINNRYLFLLLFILCFSKASVFAQQANNWYFGAGVGITFNTVPPSELPNSPLNSDEGCASISDTSGQILFLTDGVNVYGRNNNLLLAGDGLMGHTSSTQSAMIVQQPGSDHIYYLFTAPFVSDGPQVGYRYNKVDMNAENHVGAVVERNTLMHSPGSEKLTAIRHANGKDVWIILLDVENEKILAYKLSCNGLDAPVISDVPLRPNAPFQQYSLKQGYMKASPDGRILAMASTGTVNQHLHIRLCQVDNVTGVVHPPILIPADNGSYGAEFSSDSKLLYVTDHPDVGGIFQFNVSVFDSASILHSMYYINTGKNKGALQMGPDNKIYGTNFNGHFLSCINSPGIAGAGCDFVEDALDLRGTIKEGLPNFTANQAEAINVQAAIDTTIANPCNSTVQFSGSSALPGALTWLWDFGDGSTSSLQNPPPHVYSINASNNVFTVRLDVTSDALNCSNPLKATAFQHIELYFSHLNAGNDTVAIVNVPLQLRATGAGSYAWSPVTGLNDPTIANPVTTLGSDQGYIVRGTSLQGCIAYDTINVKVITSPTILVPGAFTPNNDGINDKLMAFYTGIKQLNYFRVYNRYGQLIFSTTDINAGWDGRINGKLQNTGTFVWFANAITIQGKTITNKGMFILLK